MRQQRLLHRRRDVPASKDSKGSTEKPEFYHCISRVVERRFAFGDTEKEKFRDLMRLMERFSGCRVLAYCVMSNHFHLLLEVPPMPENGISDAELLTRLRALYKEDVVGVVAEHLASVRATGNDAGVAEIHSRYTYRMHDLGQFMKGLLQRFSQWFNRKHERKGHLWEDRFKSIMVEEGYAARTMSAYIDLNPVRAGIAKMPEEYRWSSYGEAIGKGAKGDGLIARAGLVRALRGHLGVPADASLWREGVNKEYRKLLMAGAVQEESIKHDKDGKEVRTVTRKGISKEAAEAATVAQDGEIAVSQALHRRIRYFTDGVVIGSRTFVNEVFTQSRERFGPNRKDGARALRGAAAALKGLLWSMRDLRSTG